MSPLCAAAALASGDVVRAIVRCRGLHPHERRQRGMMTTRQTDGGPTDQSKRARLPSSLHVLTILFVLSVSWCSEHRQALDGAEVPPPAHDLELEEAGPGRLAQRVALQLRVAVVVVQLCQSRTIIGPAAPKG